MSSYDSACWKALISTLNPPANWIGLIAPIMVGRYLVEQGLERLSNEPLCRG